MRHDFKYVPIMSVAAAQKMARRKAKKALVTGLMVGVGSFLAWIPMLILLGVLIVTNLVQKRL